jgi:hypothetical protein
MTGKAGRQGSRMTGKKDNGRKLCHLRAQRRICAFFKKEILRLGSGWQEKQDDRHNRMTGKG